MNVLRQGSFWWGVGAAVVGMYLYNMWAGRRASSQGS